MIDRRGFMLLGLAGTSLRAQEVSEPLERLGGKIARDSAGNIVAVDLADSWANDADIRWLADIPTLERIDLSRTRITGKALEPLRGLPSVRELRLQFAEFITATDMGHLADWRNLTTLDLRGTRADSSVFERLRAHTAMEFLDVSSCEVDDQGFEELAALTKLVELRCGANRMSGLALTVLKTAPALRHLDVGGYQRVDSGLWGLALNEQNLERLGALPHLETLTLRGAKLADRGTDRPGSDLAIKKEIVGLESLRTLSELRSLDLGDLPIKSSDLSWLPELKKLEQLDIDGSYEIDDAAVATFLQLSSLKRLNLAGSLLTDAGFNRLAALPQLERLTVGATLVSGNAAAAFSSKRPGCSVIYWKAVSG